MSLTDAMLLDPYPFHRWISKRTDSAGTGTVNDPFRADTAAKFDELMRTFGAGTVVHLWPTPRCVEVIGKVATNGGWRISNANGRKVRNGK